MPKGKPRTVFNKIVRCFLGGLAGTLLVMSIDPLLGPAWHVLHGDMISHLGWRIPVPKGFWLLNEHTGPAMGRAAFGRPLRKPPFGLINLFGRAEGPPFLFKCHYEGWANALSHSQSKEGQALVGTRTLPVDGTSVYCLEFARSTGGREADVRCAIDRSTLFLFYSGDRKYLPDFYAMIQGMSLEKSGATPEAMPLSSTAGVYSSASCSASQTPKSGVASASNRP